MNCDHIWIWLPDPKMVSTYDCGRLAVSEPWKQQLSQQPWAHTCSPFQSSKGCCKFLTTSLPNSKLNITSIKGKSSTWSMLIQYDHKVLYIIEQDKQTRINLLPVRSVPTELSLVDITTHKLHIATPTFNILLMFHRVLEYKISALVGKLRKLCRNAVVSRIWNCLNTWRKGPPTAALNTLFHT